MTRAPLWQPRLAAALLAWWAVWLAPGLIASAWLLGQMRSPVAAGAALHAALLLALWLLLWLPFAADWLTGHLQPWQGRVLASALATLQLALLGFYGLSAAGHAQWGGWITWDLLRAYVPQLPRLLRALEVSWPWAAGAALAMLLAWWGLVVLHTRLLHAVLRQRAALGDGPGRHGGLALMLAMVAALMLFERSYASLPDYWWLEPLRQAHYNDGIGEAGAAPLLNPAQLQQERAALAAYTPPHHSGPARPLVLIVVDALRSDQMGVYGAPVDNTPFLSSLLRSGQLQRVDDAYSVCTVSYCGILGTLSSKFWHQITPHPWNIADALRLQGYESRFILSGDHTSFYGMRRMYGPGVDLIHDGSDQAAGHPGAYLNDDRQVLATLEATGWPRSKPGFLYVHLMSVHRLGDIDDTHRRWTAANAPHHSAYAPLDADKNADLRAHYHNGILQADDTIRQIFQRLAAWRVLDDALVVITADHGEMLGELGLTSHGHNPYEPVTRIPLLVVDRQAKAPFPPRGLVSQVDIAPTLLQAIGAQQPPNWQGVPLQTPLLRHALPLESADSTGVVAVIDGRRYKYLRLRDKGTEQLFDLAPERGGEARNRIADPAEAPTLATLRALHAQFLAGPPAR